MGRVGLLTIWVVPRRIPFVPLRDEGFFVLFKLKFYVTISYKIINNRRYLYGRYAYKTDIQKFRGL